MSVQKNERVEFMGYYIAYGSNLNITQMKSRCPQSEIVGTGEIKDYELLFKGSKTGAYLTIEKKKGSTVPVAVYRISRTDEKKLDIYEGFPNFYYKSDFKIPVVLRNGDTKIFDAFAYIMHEERKIAKPSAIYVKVCQRGYHDFGFDTKYLAEALIKSRKLS